MTVMWGYWVGGVILAGFGMWLLCWALLSDQFAGNRKFRRCSKCWYDMTAAVGLKCPECGKEAKAESGLHFSRRRWRLAGAGVLVLIIACAIGFGGSAGKERCVQAIPLRARVFFAPLIGRELVLCSLWGMREERDGEDLVVVRSVFALALEVLKDPRATFDESRCAAHLIANLEAGVPIDSAERTDAGLAVYEFCVATPAHGENRIPSALLHLLGQERVLAKITRNYPAAASDPISGPGWIRFVENVFRELKPPFSDTTQELMADLLVRDDPDLHLPDNFPYDSADAFYLRLAHYVDGFDSSHRQKAVELVIYQQNEIFDCCALTAFRLAEVLASPQARDYANRRDKYLGPVYRPGAKR
ncbi:MAG: hypothetical protein JNK16_03080 [Phycisphaerales bacterium]|nr:hypothetical protein [Phycisphaerales bacterium]